jgi:uncharacterized protein (DUF58 family)
LTIAKVILLLVVVGVIAQATAMPQAYLAVYALAAVFFVAYLWARLNAQGLDLVRETTTDSAQAGEQIEEVFTLRNHSILPKFWVEVYDYSTLPGLSVSRVVSAPSRGLRQWHAQTACRWRGKYILGPVMLTTGDPLGIFKIRKRLPQSTELVVFPATVHLTNFGGNSGEMGGMSALRQRTPYLTPNVSGIRDYAPDDSFNRISWSSTARLGRLVVKEFELDTIADVWLVVDLDESVQVTDSTPYQPVREISGSMPIPPSTEEYAITVAASLGQFFLERSLGVGLITWGHYREVIPADRGDRQLNKILQTLAVARAEGRVPLDELLAGEQLRFGPTTTLVVITSSISDEWICQIREVVQRGARAIAVIVEPSTFGGGDSALMIVGSLAALDVPTFLVKNGEPINQSLESQAPNWRNYRGRSGR